MSAFQQYRRSQIAELRPWMEGDDMTRVSVSAPDTEAGSPKSGDMIARNPKNHDDQWLVAAQYFAENFETFEPNRTPSPDKLRVAVEALEKIAGGRLNELVEAFRIARRALAALKQIQEGNADAAE